MLAIFRYARCCCRLRLGWWSLSRLLLAPFQQVCCRCLLIFLVSAPWLPPQLPRVGWIAGPHLVLLAGNSVLLDLRQADGCRARSIQSTLPAFPFLQWGISLLCPECLLVVPVFLWWGLRPFGMPSVLFYRRFLLFWCIGVLSNLLFPSSTLFWLCSLLLCTSWLPLGHLSLSSILAFCHLRFRISVATLVFWGALVFLDNVWWHSMTSCLSYWLANSTNFSTRYLGLNYLHDFEELATDLQLTCTAKIIFQAKLVQFPGSFLFLHRGSPISRM